MTFEITADEFDALMKYHEDAIQFAIQANRYDRERYHEQRIAELCRYAEERNGEERNGRS
jgi:hypothetical protein